MTERAHRRKARAWKRRVLREHRTRKVYMHSIRIVVPEPGAEIWGYWGCPRCPGVLEDVRELNA